MFSRSVSRSLRAASARKAAVPETSYRCFSCTRRAQAEPPKSAHDERMTHFGFQNVPEEQKESMGRFLSLT